MDLYISSSIKTSSIPKFMQGGCENTYRWAQTGMHGNMYVIFAAISWRRGFPVTECHKQWNICHPPGPRYSKLCLLPAKWCFCCFGALMVTSSSTTRIVDRWSIGHGFVLCLKWSWNPLFIVEAHKCWENAVVLYHEDAQFIRQQQPLKRFENWN